MHRGLLLFLLVPALAAGYLPVTVEEVARGRVGPGLVRLWGRYLPFGDYTGLVRGVLASNRYALPLEGQVFDFSPPPGAYLEVWGELVQKEGTWLLRFHNGRLPRDDRGPRPAAWLREGEVQVWLRVYQAGGGIPETVGVSEDGLAFFLPGYSGPYGVQCLVGRLELGPPRALKEVRACEER